MDESTRIFVTRCPDLAGSGRRSGSVPGGGRPVGAQTTGTGVALWVTVDGPGRFRTARPVTPTRTWTPRRNNRARPIGGGR